MEKEAISLGHIASNMYKRQAAYPPRRTARYIDHYKKTIAIEGKIQPRYGRYAVPGLT